MSNSLVIDPSALTEEQLALIMKSGAIKQAPDFYKIGENVNNIPKITTEGLNHIRHMKLNETADKKTDSGKDPILNTILEIWEQKKAEHASGLCPKSEVDLAEKAYNVYCNERKNKRQKVKLKRKKKKVVDPKLHCIHCGKSRLMDLATMYLTLEGEVKIVHLNCRNVLSSLANNENVTFPDYFLANCACCRENTYYKIQKHKSKKKLVLADSEISAKIAEQFNSILSKKMKGEDVPDA